MFAEGIFPQRTLHQVRSDGEKKISGSDGWIAFLAPDQLHSPIFLLNLLTSPSSSSFSKFSIPPLKKCDTKTIKKCYQLLSELYLHPVAQKPTLSFMRFIFSSSNSQIYQISEAVIPRQWFSIHLPCDLRIQSREL